MAVAAVLGAVAALAAPTALRAQAQDLPVSYEASAAADGLRAEVRTPGLFLSNLFDGGLPVAQAQSNDLGTSQGFAAMPYPGESVGAITGLLLPLFGLPALPPFPLQVSASYPAQPDAAANAGVFVVNASGRRDGATGSVTAGVNAGPARGGYLEVSATTDVDPATGDVVARSRTLLQGLSVAGLISIGRVEASAEVTGGPGAETVKRSAFEVEGLALAGVRLAVTDKGIELLGLGDLPLPDLQLNQILEQAGLRIQYLQARETDGGIMSAGLEITIPPFLPAPYDLTLTLTLGRARASADVVSGVADEEAPVDLGDGTGAIEVPAFSPVDLDASGPGQRPPAAPSTRTISSIGALDVSVVSFYLVLVAATIVALLSVALLRRSGVKPPWTS
ncbi:MAG: hypothetical protein M3Z03_03120 [Actinomycetota bacterium]|nr:hypothetical protein [Actinomycetota bacterium]